MRRFFPFERYPADAVPLTEAPPAPVSLPTAPAEGYPLWVSFGALGLLLAAIPLTVIYGRTVAPWILPGLMIGFLIYGVARRVAIYEVFVEGVKEGFQVAIRIIPYLVAILVRRRHAAGERASGRWRRL